MAYLQLKGVVKKFNQVDVVKRLSLDIKKGELISFLGPSGCGKTTTLNMIAGFLDVDGGAIEVEGKPVHLLPPHKRNMGMVFQNYALFPHMTVFENASYGLKLRKVTKSEIHQRVQEALEMVNLEGYEKRYPKELSGGQQQRVALARALVIRPLVLLLDEPLSNLDAKLRQKMREEIVEIQKRVGITTIFVTHDQEEALAISDRIAVMNKGKIEQIDTPENIYNNPQSAFVSQFIGEVNQLEGTVLETNGHASNIRVLGSSFSLPEVNIGKGSNITLFIRPERIRISKTIREDQICYESTLERKMFLGSKTRYILKVENARLIADIGNSELDPATLKEGSTVYATWYSNDLFTSSKEVVS
ncbi:ABC transporter ATP-binding protein [Pseudalkalibacillus decolorationis]|uniref:ABC transporter ATP-binding protein n=1 Tax=Pseudalkalibacillus decolorationis TaxID=163879 RepID=UPI002148E60B|nr:ABC transporter ATP-binding protein [Pseudalkalibacillus decolorationis]